MPDEEDDTISEGTEVEDEVLDTDSTSTDSTAENVAVNDPEKNKKLAEITISENIRDTYSLEITIPRILKGLHTNQFFFMDVSDEFYEKNYGTLADIIASKKFARYAGFEKGRFFVDKVKFWGGMSGTGTTITLNPLPDSYSQYMKAQQDAEKALIQALSSGNNGGGTTTDGEGLTNMSGDDCSKTTLSMSVTSDSQFEKSASNLIGNSSANYATDTSSMSGKSALMDIRGRYKWSNYRDNHTCPQKMWTTGTIRGNCADISRLCMCVGQVHGLRVGVFHTPGHYFNLIQVNGKVYRFDCCCQSRGKYGGVTTNNLCMNGGPWS